MFPLNIKITLGRR